MYYEAIIWVSGKVPIAHAPIRRDARGFLTNLATGKLVKLAAIISMRPMAVDRVKVFDGVAR